LSQSSPSAEDDMSLSERKQAEKRRAIAEAALKVNSDAIVLVHGGPVAMPDDAEFILKNTDTCHGFYGASSMERLPTEVAMTEQTRAFKRIKGR